MELTKEFVKSCKSVGLLRDFLLQAMDQVDTLEKQNKELKEAQRWRKCSEELPEEGVEVLVTNGIDYSISDWCGDYWNNDPFCGYTVFDNVIAWMPLPKGPNKK